jgi:single-stranded-DNA-specific exonuclease
LQESRRDVRHGILTDVVEPRFRWSFPVHQDLEPAFLAEGAGHGLSVRLLEVLARRGVAADELAGFFAAPITGLADPVLLPDAAVFAQRVATARARGERVMVFGDFDADGLTGLAILVRTFRRLGIDVTSYVPRRLEEGHGLSLVAVETAAESGICLIVTVDCGTSSGVEIAVAARRGIEVLVTDHHRVPPVLPPALAVVNPMRADSRYPHRRLAGSGVAFKLAQLLLAAEPDGPEAALDLADLATIGTVADVAPILGENRAIARLGLERLRARPRAGIAALLERAGVAAHGADLETVAYVLAPRINAAGRVGEPADAARLLQTDDPDEARALAERVDDANVARRALTRDVVADADAAIGEIAPDAAAILVRGDWPVGIVGLVASRLTDRTGRPAVVGATVGDAIRGSCRSVPGFDLADALAACGDLFTRYGGHAGAAGFELPAERWPAFVERFLALAATAVPADPRPELRLDLALPALEVDYRLLRELQALAPTGPGNPDPLVAVFGLTVTRIRAATGGHTQLTLKRRIDVLDAIAFDRADLAETVREGDRIDVVARVMSRTFGGYESLQLEIRDLAPEGRQRPATTDLEAPAALAAVPA